MIQRDFSFNNLQELAREFRNNNGMHVQTVTVSIELILVAGLIQHLFSYDFIVDRDMERGCWQITAIKDEVEYGQFINPA